MKHFFSASKLKSAWLEIKWLEHFEFFYFKRIVDVLYQCYQLHAVNGTNAFWC